MSNSKALDKYKNLAVTTSGRIVSNYGSAIIEVVTSVYMNIRRWLNGEISGKRCAKNIIDDSMRTGGALAGAAGGAAAGSFAGPIGAAIGGTVGAVAGAALSKFLTQITGELFDLPKTQALEKAYKFMGLYHRCSNEEVNKRYKQLALVYHPDKPGGSGKQFVMLNSCVSIIKASRQ